VTRSRRWYAAVALVLLAAVLAACGGGGDDSDEVTGLILDVRGRGNDVRSFTLRAGDQTYDIRIAPEVDYGFELSHLRSHEMGLFPVRCKLERRDGRLYALEIVDA
jgi:hypothetical protein